MKRSTLSALALICAMTSAHAQSLSPDDLARRAVELGVDAKFQQDIAADDIIESLQQSGEPGRALRRRTSAMR